MEIKKKIKEMIYSNNRINAMQVLCNYQIQELFKILLENYKKNDYIY